MTRPTPLVRDALIAVATFAAGAILLASGAYVHRGPPEGLFLLPLAATCFGVAVRRRAPVAALALGTAGFAADMVIGPSLGTLLVFTDNLYAATLYGPRPLGRVLLWITSVGAVTTGAVGGFVTGDWRALAGLGVQGALIGITPVVTANIVRQHRDQAANERARAEQVARLAELDRRAAVTAERTHMARELHDLVANHFSAIAIQSTALLSREDLDPDTVRKLMRSIRENSLQGMAEMRTMIGLLRDTDDGLHSPSGAPTLGGHRSAGGDHGTGGDEPVRPRLADAAELIERTGLPVRLAVAGRPRELPAAVDLAAYRILQEALTNALKHGDAGTGVAAEVTVEYGRGRVVLTVDNPVGEGPPALPGGGAGLIGMRERAAMLGGSFTAGPHGPAVHTNTPNTNTNTPRMDTPRLNTPNTNTPRMDTPRLNTPNTNTPRTGDSGRSSHTGTPYMNSSHAGASDGKGPRGKRSAPDGSFATGARITGWRVRAELPVEEPA